MGRFTDRVAIITGAGAPEGIGAAVARQLVAEGARVVLGATSQRIHDRAAELGDAAVGVIADLTAEGSAPDGPPAFPPAFPWAGTPTPAPSDAAEADARRLLESLSNPSGDAVVEAFREATAAPAPTQASKPGSKPPDLNDLG